MMKGATAIDSKTKLERKRETDRKAQRASRAKTKAYIAFLESQASSISENPASGDLSQKLKAQWEENQKLRTTLQGIESLIKDVLAQQKPAEDQKLLNDSPSSSHTHSAFLDPSGSLLPLEPTHHSSPDSDSTLICSFTGSRDYFTILSSALEFMELLGADLATPDMASDEDIIIRAVLHGWDTIPETALDIGWRTLKLVDQGLFHLSGAVERIAILRVQRSMFLSSSPSRHQDLHPRQRPPNYMLPTPLQLSCIPHARLVDYFSWPSIRDYLLLNDIAYAPESISAQFARDVGFSWGFEVRDLCKKDKETGRYGFSREFDEAYGDLENWYFREEATAGRFPRTRGCIAQGPEVGLEALVDCNADGLGVGVLDEVWDGGMTEMVL